MSFQLWRGEGRDGRVGGGLRGGVGDTVRNQRREEHLRRKQNRLLNIASNTRGEIVRFHSCCEKLFRFAPFQISHSILLSFGTWSNTIFIKWNYLKLKGEVICFESLPVRRLPVLGCACDRRCSCNFCPLESESGKQLLPSGKWKCDERHGKWKRTETQNRARRFRKRKGEGKEEGQMEGRGEEIENFFLAIINSIKPTTFEIHFVLFPIKLNINCFNRIFRQKSSWPILNRQRAMFSNLVNIMN